VLQASPARLGLLIGCVVILAAGGCWDSAPDRIVPPGIDAAAAGQGAMEQYDTNKDGKVDGEELDKAPTLKAAIDNLDTNKDGAVSADEVAARVKTWQDSRVGVYNLSCTVYYKGKPLSDATVTFVPEKFLGDSVKPATGVTDQSGTVCPSVAQDASNADFPPGAHPGLFLVKITKDGLNIPAKYNAETTLGEEVSQDGKRIIEPMDFYLK
jgi:hypothetical protein